VEKLDLKKQYRELYLPSARECAVVDVPELQFLMIDGRGDPNTSDEYRQVLEALYGMSYTLKFLSKQTEEIDYVVMALEGLWWTDDMADFSEDDKSAWSWTSMIMQPSHLTKAHFEGAADQLRAKRNPMALDKMRFESFHEGLSVQIMHIGPYAEEAPTISRLHQYAVDNGYRIRDKHHEIYLSDPRRAAPEKLRTVIRQPVEPA
jgi:hypothetical protein